MKKVILFAAAALAMTACGNTEKVNDAIENQDVEEVIVDENGVSCPADSVVEVADTAAVEEVVAD